MNGRDMVCFAIKPDRLNQVDKLLTQFAKFFSILLYLHRPVMVTSKADIIARLNREILPLQGYKPLAHAAKTNTGLGSIEQAFPGKSFPLAAIHEFCCNQQEDEAATGGFIAGLLSTIMVNGGTAVWIGRSPIIFPPALKFFGLAPERVIFVAMQKDKDMLWAMEEALKCGGLTAVIGEIRELSFTVSRRFQLAVEHSNVTGFIVRHNPRQLNTTASLTRWKICSLPSDAVDELPGVGFPRWQVDLLKVRNGKPGSWQMEWANGRFRQLPESKSIIHELKKKTG
jgi:protein ImuA